ncbi:hypothetical protein ABTP59_18740, partial [Acinetobacter baumannii]
SHGIVLNRDIFMLSGCEKCDECGSQYLKSKSSMASLCPECASIIYGYANCEHVFKEGRCIHCYWDGSTTTYIEDLKKNS